MPVTLQALIANLARAYPRQPVAPETFGIYLEDLAGISVAVLEVALIRLRRTSEWFPTLRAIREVCAELVLELPSEQAALAQVQAYLRGTINRAEVHPLVDEAVKLAGGFRELRESTNQSVVRGQLARAYRELRAAAVLEAQTADHMGHRAALAA